MAEAAWFEPHHDGSALYVLEPNPKLGGTASVLLRVPRASDMTSAWVRVSNDGEPELVRAALPVVNPVVSYRWLLDGGPHGY